MSVTEWVTAAPAPGLHPFVTGYVGYRLLGQTPGLHRGLPSRNMTLIFGVDRTIDVVSQTNPRHGSRRYRTVLGGLHDSPALIAHDGNQEGVAVELSPLGSRALLGLPASELWDLTIEVGEAVGRRAAELWERLHETDDWDARFTACDRALAGMMGGHAVAPELARAWEALVHSGGQVAVAELAREVGYSRQHLRHRFTQEFGVGPKRAARLIRFERATELLREPAPDFSRVAVACGYYDQAHMHRDFATLAGCTPAELIAGDLPFFQDQPAPMC